MRDSAVFVLPSFYEGLPLVLVEALACGCRLVCTDLEGVRREIAPYLGAALTLVPMPRLRTVDQPEADDIPAFVDALTTSIARALGQPPLGDPSQTMPEALEHFRWSAVCERIEAVWTRLLQTSA
jgi:glycosyltransferase involved in cell wall biosynthesis